MFGSRQRRVVSEGSLSPTVASNRETERSRKGGKGRGDQERTGKGGGVGSVLFSRGNQKGIWRRDLEGGGGVRRVTWGRVMWRGLQTGLE